ncbi:hypothetical protein HOE04_00105 [archaeon]|jgi:hypothetical protein|nr:hypothetical protein [archaeon]
MEGYAEGTLGAELEYRPPLKIFQPVLPPPNEDWFTTQQDEKEKLHSLTTLHKHNKGILELELDNEPSPTDEDDFLRELNF